MHICAKNGAAFGGPCDRGHELRRAVLFRAEGRRSLARHGALQCLRVSLSASDGRARGPAEPQHALCRNRLRACRARVRASIRADPCDGRRGARQRRVPCRRRDRSAERIRNKSRTARRIRLSRRDRPVFRKSVLLRDAFPAVASARDPARPGRGDPAARKTGIQRGFSQRAAVV